MPVDRFLLPGSERTPQEDARLAGTPALIDIIDVTLFLRRRATLDLSRQSEPITREPASTLVQVVTLARPEFILEIEVIAAVSSGR